MKFSPARAAFGLAALAGVCLAATAAEAQGRPDPAALLRQTYEASGGANWEGLQGVEVSGAYEAGGLKGTFSQRVDLRRGRDVFSYRAGPLKDTQGSSAHGSWWADEKGLPSVQDTPDALADAATQSYEDRNGWFHPGPDDAPAFVGEKTDGGRTFELVRLSPPGARPMTLWIDAATHRLARLVVVDADQRVTTTSYGDYRHVHGVWFPFTQRTSSGDPSADSIATARQVVFRPLPERDFEPPPSRILDARLLTGGRPAVIAFQLVAGEIIVPVSVDGGPPLPFFLDSGALNLITPEAARRLHVDVAGALNTNGAGDAQATASVAHVRSYRVGQAELTDQRFVVIPLPRDVIALGGAQPLAGLIGYEFLRRFAVRIDFHRKLLTVWPPGEAAPPGSGAVVPLRLGGRDLFIEASLAGAKGLFGVDTGDDGSVTLFKSFFRSHAIPVELPPIRSLQEGVGGQSATLTTRAPDLTIGPYAIPRPLIDLRFAAGGAFASDQLAGNLGTQVFRNLVTTFDLPHRRLYVKPAPEFGYAQPYNRTGAHIQLGEDGRVTVAQIDEGSPAAIAGLVVGDQLVKVNGEAVSGAPITRFGDWATAPAGSRMAFDVLRGAKPVRVEFVAKELLPRDGRLVAAPDLSPEPRPQTP
ncbi:MAG TPA: aspartyl protease family protein [Caulobacteraceae bacterium]|jgi:hypothetical protein